MHSTASSSSSVEDHISENRATRNTCMRVPCESDATAPQPEDTSLHNLVAPWNRCLAKHWNYDEELAVSVLASTQYSHSGSRKYPKVTLLMGVRRIGEPIANVRLSKSFQDFTYLPLRGTCLHITQLLISPTEMT